MTKTRKRKRYTTEKMLEHIAHEWCNVDDVGVLAEDLDISISQVYSLSRQLRARGVELPHHKRGRK